MCQNCKNLFADIFLGLITALFEISWNCNCNLEYLSYLGENKELTGTKVPHMKVTGTVTKFHLKSNFPIPDRETRDTLATFNPKSAHMNMKIKKNN